MRDVANRENIPMIDLMASTLDHYQNDFATSEECRAAYSQGGTDNTHTNQVGARVRAELFRQGALALGGGFAHQFLGVE